MDLAPPGCLKEGLCVRLKVCGVEVNSGCRLKYPLPRALLLHVICLSQSSVLASEEKTLVPLSGPSFLPGVNLLP